MNVYVSERKIETNFTFNETLKANKTKNQQYFDTITSNIDEISKKGLVKISFNKKIDGDLLNSAISNKDLNNKTLKLSIIPGSDSNINKLNFYWSTISYSDGILQLQINFDNPASISYYEVS
jgi:hypothetical protein